MLSVLSDTQKAIVETITMRLHPQQALSYLKDLGYEMSKPTYYRQKKKIENMKFDRMQYIALHFQDQHLERVDKCEIIEKEMWKNYYLEKDPTKKVHILMDILEMQTYLSVYYDATRYVLMQSIQTHADLDKSPTNYVSIDVKRFRERELEQQKEQGKLFNPYPEVQPIGQGQGHACTQSIEDEEDDVRAWK